jgi:hypothetical protein
MPTSENISALSRLLLTESRPTLPAYPPMRGPLRGRTEVA